MGIDPDSLFPENSRATGQQKEVRKVQNMLHVKNSQTYSSICSIAQARLGSLLQIGYHRWRGWQVKSVLQ